MKSYVQYQHSNGHSSLTVTPVGFHISLTHPYLGASPDGAVYDPSAEGEPFGFVEIKCPYTAQNMTPVEACSLPSFFVPCHKTQMAMIRLLYRQITHTMLKYRDN